jgi:hypothetical protein
VPRRPESHFEEYVQAYLNLVRRAGAHHRRHWIEMHAQRHHTGNEIKWRLYMRLTALEGPRAKAGDIDTLPDRDRAILVPGQGPVGRGGLVE